MTTASTEDLYTQLRNRLLGYVPPAPLDVGWITLNTRLGGQAAGSGRLYKDAPPDDAAYPNGVMRIINRLSLSERERADLEIVLYGRPRSQAVDIEGAADVCDQAMLNYVDSSSGLTFSRERQRDTLEGPTDAADRELVQVRVVYSLKFYPVYLTQYTTA